MKKFIKILLWILAGIIFSILLIFFLVNNGTLQKKIASKYVQSISFKKIRILPNKVIIDSLSLKKDEIDIKDLNIELRFNIFKLASWEIKKVKLSLDSISLDLPVSQKKKTKEPFKEIELPILPQKIPDIEEISINVNKIIVHKLAKVDHINIYGNIKHGKLDIKSDKILFVSKEFKTSAAVKINIYGKLYKNVALDLMANGRYDTYALSCNVSPISINLKKWELSSNITIKAPQFGKIFIKNIKIIPFKEKINIKLGHFYTADLKTENIYPGLKINKLNLDIKDIDLDYHLDNSIKAKKGNISIGIQGAYANKSMNVSNAKSDIKISIKNNDLSLDTKIGASGNIDKDTFTVSLLANAIVKDLLKKQNMSISSKVKANYKKNKIDILLNAKGNKENLKTQLTFEGDINEKIKDILAKARISIKSEQNYEKDFLKGSSVINIDLHQLKMQDMNLYGQEIALTIGNRTDFNTLSISLSAKNSYLNGNFLATLNMKNNDVNVEDSEIALLLGNLPLKMLNIKDIAINKGTAKVYLDSISIVNKRDIRAKLRLALKDIVLTGMQLEKLYMPLLKNNIIQISIEGDLVKKNINGKFTLNGESSNLYADYKFNYIENDLDAKGKCIFDSKRMMIPIYAPFLFRGKFEIPANINIVNNKDIYIKGRAIFDHFYVSSPEIKINRLSGYIPLNINMNKIFEQKLPSVMEKPIVDITPIEKSKANLTIGRLYYGKYEVADMKFNIDFNNYLNINHLYFRFARGVGNGSVKYTLSNKFWLSFNFTNGYLYEMLKTSPKGFSKDDTKINIHSLVYGDLTELNGYVKMPGLGRSVLLNILYMVDPQAQDPQIQSLTSKVKFLGYYPETIELKLDGSTMSIYVPLKKRGLNPLNIPFSIQNIPIKKLLKSMSSKNSGDEDQ
ncbi:hypothetical protein J7L48_05140 [bacterium]|nr:hypothetical protein [bacterium]